MNLYRLIFALALAASFAGGYHTYRYLHRPIVVPVAGSARDYIRQYSCWHAIVTGNIQGAKSCV
jgi:hypothetical protein